jgi:hypothetical protein
MANLDWPAKRANQPSRLGHQEEASFFELLEHCSIQPALGGCRHRNRLCNFAEALSCSSRLARPPEGPPRSDCPTGPLEITHGHEARRVSATRSEDQRDGASCNGDGTGLRTGAAADCNGGAEILSRISCSAACSFAAKSRAICSWPAATWTASWSTL